MNVGNTEEWLKLREASQASIISDVVEQGSGLPDVLLAYQQEGVGLLDTAGTNVLVVEKSRRIGYTWGLAAYAVLKASRARSARGMDVMYISYSQEMTREFIDAAAMWAKAFSIAALASEEFLFSEEDENGEKHSIQAFRIRFDSGFEIVGLSSAPRSLRGKQGVVIIDEAAFVDSLEELMKAALAFLMWGGQVVVCSTHQGTENYFNRLIQDIHSGRLNYKHRRIDFDDALRAGLYKRICLVMHEEWTPEKEAAWRDQIVKSYGDGADEELFCVPSQGSGAWLSTELIERQMKQPPELIIRWQWPEDYLQWGAAKQQQYMSERKRELDVMLKQLNPKHRHALGFDFARVADLSEVVVDAIDAMLMRPTAFILEMRRVPYEEQFQLVHHIWQQLPRTTGGAFDATGAGGYVAEAMARRFGAYDQKAEVGGMIAEIKLSIEWYRLHMPKLKSAFEEGNTTIPKDAELLADLRTVKVVKGVATIPDVRTGTKGLKRHGDFAVAKALAWYASLMNTSEYDYQSLGDKTAARGDGFWTSPSERDDIKGGDTSWREPLGARMKGSI